MLQEDVLALLEGQGDEAISGQAMAEELGVSRAAVWKAVEGLRQRGYAVSSAPNRGYRLEGRPLDIQRLEQAAQREAPILWLETVGSTNDELKRRLVAEGAALPTGTAVLAGQQTGGRGRLGRSFLSPAGKGIYLSLLLRPVCPLEQVGMLTAWAAVAVCDAVEQVCGVRPGIKWPNDLVLGGRKVCGILTELEIEAGSGAPPAVILGIGLNLRQTAADFGEELARTATSLAQETGQDVDPTAMAAAELRALDRLAVTFPSERSAYLAAYRRDCVTLGREIAAIGPGGSRQGTALDVDEDFALQVRWPDSSEESISSGEVSVRGLYGYA